MRLPHSSDAAAGSEVDLFVLREDGAMTALSLLLLTATFIIGGLAIDVANVMSQRTHLQITADSAAHAALVERVGLRIGERRSEEDAKNYAIRLSSTNMPRSRFGGVLTAEDITFGDWTNDPNVPLHDRFTPIPGSTRAVQVFTARNEGHGNPISTFLLRLVGVDAWNVTTPSVFETYQPACLREGFVAEGRVDMQSNNVYLRGFCVHSNTLVSINQNNYFEAGTVVSMPDLDLLELPNSGYERNEGLEAALREGSMDIRILNELENIIAGLGEADRDYLPEFVTNYLPNEITLTANNNTLLQDDLLAGAVNNINCTRSGGRISIPNSELIENVVIVTNCQIELGSNARIESSVVATTSTASTSVTGASGSTFGADDDCAPGGGAQVITLGGMRFPSGLGIFGSQLLAQSDVEFAARADGIQGASIVAGGEIDATSNSTMALCNTGMEGNFEIPYFRMAM